MDKKFVSKENAAVLYDALKSYVDTEVSDANTQYEVMPAASAENEGQIIQYTGQTDQNYTNGYFYQVVSDGAVEPTYSWVVKQVNPATDLSNYLAKNNTTSFTPSGDYNPATKKYVDDSVPNFSSGTADPTGGSDGDIYFQYSA